MNHGQEFRKYAVKHLGISGLATDQYISCVNKISAGYISPTIIEERQLNIAQLDVFSRLIMDRLIFLRSGIDDTVSSIIQGQLLFLQSTDPTKDIQLYIHSGGGECYSGLAIYDTMQLITPDVATVVTGLAASMAMVLLCGGTKGKRSALKHSKIMMHQPSGGTRGQSSEIEIYYKEIQSIKNELYSIISDHTGKSIKQITKDADRDNWMTSEEAKEYGIIDDILMKK